MLYDVPLSVKVMDASIILITHYASFCVEDRLYGAGSRASASGHTTVIVATVSSGPRIYRVFACRALIGLYTGQILAQPPRGSPCSEPLQTIERVISSSPVCNLCLLQPLVTFQGLAMLWYLKATQLYIRSRHVCESKELKVLTFFTIASFSK
jgi:hypothetical protein